MEAVISELWETGIDIITTESDDNSITSLSDLRKCSNVLVGGKFEYGTEILLGDSLLYVTFREVSHPTGHGKLHICQIC